MEVHLTPEQQHLLAELAAQRGRDADALAQEAISQYVAEEARFVEAVKLGETALERGECLTHEQVGERLGRLVERESARKLASLEGAMPALKSTPRRRVPTN